MSVTLSLFAGVGAQFLDNNGNILSGGLIYTYSAGTTTPLTTYTTNLGTVAQPNPIILDSAGRIPGGELWLSTGYGYKFVTTDSNNVVIGTYDNVPSSAQPPITNDAASIAYEQGNTTVAGYFVIGQTYLIKSLGTTNFQLIGAASNTIGIHFIATGIGSGTGTAEFSRTTESKLQEIVSVKDFGAIGNYSESTNTGTDDTVAFQTALDYINSKSVIDEYSLKGQIYIPEGKYLISNTLKVYGRTSITGPGTIIYSGSGICLNLSPANVSQVQIEISEIGIMCTSATATVAIYSLNNLRQTFQSLTIAGDPTTAYGVTRWTTAGIQIDSLSPNNAFLINILNCTIWRVAGDCILFTGTGGQDTINIRGCSIEASDGYGIRHINNTYSAIGHLTIDENIIEGFGNSAVWIQFGINGQITNNHFEYSGTPSYPTMILGDAVYVACFFVANNSFSPSSTNDFTIGLMVDSTIQNNAFGGSSGYAIGVTQGLARTCVLNNNLTGTKALFTSSSYPFFSQVDLQIDGQKTFYANALYSSFKQKTNGAFAGVQSIKPGDTGSSYYKNVYGDICLFSVGDAIYNSAPTIGGYAGWICTSAGYAHTAIAGTLTSGSNQITSVTGGIYDWAAGDLICTNTDALGVPFGTTILNIVGSTITISTNATANGTGVSLYGARFNTFGLITA